MPALFNNAALALFLLLTACNTSQPSTDTDKQPLSDAIHKPLEQAQGVEKQILDNAEQQKKQADAL